MRLTVRHMVVGLTLVGFAAALALAGCSAGDSDSASLAGDAAPREAAPEQQAGKDRAPGNPPPAQAPAGYQLANRSLVFTGSVSVRVADVEDAATRVTAIATAAGGFVGADKRSSDDQRSEATIQLRVPAGRFGTAVDEVAKLGRPESRDVNTQDVTEEVVDLDAKLASQTASVARTRALFAQAKTIGEITSVESELAKRESELASLQARKRKLDDLTTLSTITVTLLGPDAPAARAAEDDPAGFLAGLKTGWEGFVGALRVVLVVLGFLLPFAIVLGAPAGVVWWLLRQRRRRAAT
jgi:Domain of unknown function (DUF4349)